MHRLPPCLQACSGRVVYCSRCPPLQNGAELGWPELTRPPRADKDLLRGAPQASSSPKLVSSISYGEVKGVRSWARAVAPSSSFNRPTRVRVVCCQLHPGGRQHAVAPLVQVGHWMPPGRPCVRTPCEVTPTTRPPLSPRGNSMVANRRWKLTEAKPVSSACRTLQFWAVPGHSEVNRSILGRRLQWRDGGWCATAKGMCHCQSETM